MTVSCNNSFFFRRLALLLEQENILDLDEITFDLKALMDFSPQIFTNVIGCVSLKSHFDKPCFSSTYRPNVLLIEVPLKYQVKLSSFGIPFASTPNLTSSPSVTVILVQDMDTK